MSNDTKYSVYVTLEVPITAKDFDQAYDFAYEAISTVARKVNSACYIEKIEVQHADI